MARIKSLLYRELVISGTLYIARFSVMILFMGMGWLVCLSMKIGNIAKALESEPEFIEWICNIICYAFNYFVSFVAGSLLIADNGIITSDIKSNWRVFGFTLPATEKERALVKLIIKAVCIITAFLISIINGLVLSGILGIEFTLKNISIYLLIIDVLIINDFFYTLIQLRARTTKEASLANLSSFALIIMVIIALRGVITDITGQSQQFQESFGDLNDDELSFEAIKFMMQQIVEKIENIMPFALPVMLVFLIGGFFLNIHMMKRRYK